MSKVLLQQRYFTNALNFIVYQLLFFKRHLKTSLVQRENFLVKPGI